MSSWKNSTKHMKISTAILILAVAFFLTGFSSTSWSTVKYNGVSYSLGLWKFCACSPLCICYSLSELGLDDFLPGKKIT